MWIAPATRGFGIGRRLLGELERTAGEAGVVVLRLETNRAVSEAIALYKRSGYAEVKAFNAETYAVCKVARLHADYRGNRNAVGDDGPECRNRLRHSGKAQGVLTPFESHGCWSYAESEDRLIGARTQSAGARERKNRPNRRTPGHR